jgi:predicted NAD-dependent protein-ADP-ribosyltransferase YbiA (DUF1768 family)
MQTTVPSEHQALGRKAKGFNRSKWDEREFMAAFHIKFLTSITTDNSNIRQEPHRRRRQLPQIHQRQGKLVDGEEAARDGRQGACGSKSLLRSYNNIQASPTDRIWGVGFGAADAEENRSKWGENRLGEAITRVRERLRSESK